MPSGVTAQCSPVGLLMAVLHLSLGSVGTIQVSVLWRLSRARDRRHSFASHLTMRGVPLKAIQELLGHTTIEMTMRYSHLSPEVRRDAVTLLDDGCRGAATASRSCSTVRSVGS